jgi:hypothetical protein
LAKGFRRYHIANLILARAKQAECGAQKSRPWCEV